MKSKESFRKVQGCVKSSIWNSRLGGTTEGWMGERSVAMTEAEGNWSAKSMAHIPVPVPMSRTRWGFEAMGARKSAPLSESENTW
jgi:hypothetical protein